MNEHKKKERNLISIPFQDPAQAHLFCTYPKRSVHFLIENDRHAHRADPDQKRR